MALERLQKIIAGAGIASRRKAEQLITSGKVKVNGKVIDKLGARADASKDHIKVNGKLLQPMAVPKNYFLAFKPVHVITSLSDPQGRTTIADLLRANRIRKHVFPVGRLDWDTDGLLLLTNDGELANQVMHPRAHLPKTYRVKVRGCPTDKALARLCKGITISGTKTLPARIEKARVNENSTVLKVVLIEGRHHQLKIMFERIGHPVQAIRRVAIGPLALGSLQQGQIRRLTDDELMRLKKELRTREDR
jgi:23S rRNA pseudouridine2605 synthase